MIVIWPLGKWLTHKIGCTPTVMWLPFATFPDSLPIKSRGCPKGRLHVIEVTFPQLYSLPQPQIMPYWTPESHCTSLVHHPYASYPSLATLTYPSYLSRSSLRHHSAPLPDILHAFSQPIVATYLPACLQATWDLQPPAGFPTELTVDRNSSLSCHHNLRTTCRN